MSGQAKTAELTASFTSREKRKREMILTPEFTQKGRRGTTVTLLAEVRVNSFVRP